MTTRRKWKKGRDVPAYMTVEAALLLPLILQGMALLICLSFFMYDQCTYEQDAYFACFKASITKEEGKAMEVLKKTADAAFSKGYLMAGTPSYSAGESGSMFTVKGSGKAGLWETDFTGQAERFDPPYGIRKYRRLGYLAGRVLDTIAPEKG
ncbi:MAG: hypothetical protein J5935_05560 [Lachnospiraceae bacterium]|nr:hypothetical protein [Lachnospiraceae bacterium]